MFFVEGNVGTGKSTFLKKLNEILDVPIILEPVDEWMAMRNFASGKNLLEEFYDNQARWAYTFQSVAFRTRLKNLMRIAPGDRSTCIIERSVFTDRNVFAKTCHENAKMDDIEWGDYLSWFDWLIDSLEIRPSGYIYLRADPEVSHDRVKVRKRGGEDAIPLEYLKSLHQKHDEWLLNEPNVLVIDVNEDFEYDSERLSDMIKQVRKFIKR